MTDEEMVHAQQCMVALLRLRQQTDQAGVHQLATDPATPISAVVWLLTQSLLLLMEEHGPVGPVLDQLMAGAVAASADPARFIAEWRDRS